MDGAGTPCLDVIPLLGQVSGPIRSIDIVMKRCARVRKHMVEDGREAARRGSGRCVRLEPGISGFTGPLLQSAEYSSLEDRVGSAIPELPACEDMDKEPGHHEASASQKRRRQAAAPGPTTVAKTPGKARPREQPPGRGCRRAPWSPCDCGPFRFGSRGAQAGGGTSSASRRPRQALAYPI